MANEIRSPRPMEPMMMNSDMHNNKGNGSSRLPWVVLALVVLAVLIGAVLFRDKLFPGDSETKGAVTEGKNSGYQAVFLSNGQVYFGKLSDTAGTYATMKDIYYLQVTQPPIQGSQQDQAAAAANQQLSLVKLGNELHGPVDEMKINRDQILFFEDIKEDGRVMQAIREYQKNPPPANQQQQGSTQQAPATQIPATNSNTNR
ncbi:MAG: hypothetical protein M3Q64_00225 [bacterium]|nr:hypothetical protein [bacterium]